MILGRKSIKATKSIYSYARACVDRYVRIPNTAKNENLTRVRALIAPEGAKSVPHLMPANAGAATEDWSQTKRRKPQAYAAKKSSIEGQGTYLA